MIVFGIKQCDTVRKARVWLDKRKIEYKFHDLRTDGFNQQMLSQWLTITDLNVLLNRRSTTWRQLPALAKESTDIHHLGALLVEHPTLVKRPVFFKDNKVIAVGFTAVTQEKLESMANV